MDMYGDWMGDAASSSNTSSSPSWWDTIINIGGKVVEYGAKKAIDKEFNTNLLGANQQPISTRAVAAPTPLANPLPIRGMQDTVPNYIQSMDMQPFLLLGGAFVVVLILVMSFGRK